MYGLSNTCEYTSSVIGKDLLSCRDELMCPDDWSPFFKTARLVAVSQFPSSLSSRNITEMSFTMSVCACTCLYIHRFAYIFKSKDKVCRYKVSAHSDDDTVYICGCGYVGERQRQSESDAKEHVVII